MPGLPVYYQLPELAQTHVHRVNVKKEFTGLDSISGLSVLVLRGHLSSGL